jgi:hypothetical protein
MELQSELVDAERAAREGAELKYRALAAETTAADTTRALEAVEAVEKQVTCFHSSNLSTREAANEVIR